MHTLKFLNSSSEMCALLFLKTQAVVSALTGNITCMSVAYCIDRNTEQEPPASENSQALFPLTYWKGVLESTVLERKHTGRLSGHLYLYSFISDHTSHPTSHILKFSKPQITLIFFAYQFLHICIPFSSSFSKLLPTAQSSFV